MATLPEFYQATLVPALLRIQREYGYLQRDALTNLSKEARVPLHRIQAVASFFPHFVMAPPPRATMHVCRDMACHLNGSAQLIADLQPQAGQSFAVKGVSCLGRCDRPVACNVSIPGVEHEKYYLGRDALQLRQILNECVEGRPPHADHDIDLPYSRDRWKIDPYAGRPPAYEALQRAVAVRDASIATAQKLLREQGGWGDLRLEQFRRAAIGQMRVDFPVDDAVADAVRGWQLGEGWAGTNELGNWSETLLKELKDGDLRGMGGAGIPAIQKWRDVRDAIRGARRHGTDRDDRAFIVVNGDESEPATFKDRELLLRSPHLIIEGVILAGLLTEATQGFIYIRHEYHEQIEACREEIRRCEEMGFCGESPVKLGRPFHMSVFVSPGGYICGEQSALIEAMSDHRGEPRNMPPKLETNGLIDLPTLVSNVETYAWAPYIIVRSGQGYAQLGMNTWKGGRFFSVSGDVQRPGVYEVAMGMTLRDLIFGKEYCQGMSGGRTFKAFAPSGPSGGFLPAKLTPKSGLPRKHTENKSWQALAQRHGFDPTAQELDLLDLELELNLFRALSPTQALGAGLVVYGNDRDMMVEALNSNEFYRNESCGKCVPCRLGSQKYVSLATHLVRGEISSARWHNELEPLFAELGKAIELASICGLGRSIPVPLRTVMNYFPEDIEKHLAK